MIDLFVLIIFCHCKICIKFTTSTIFKCLIQLILNIFPCCIPIITVHLQNLSFQTETLYVLLNNNAIPLPGNHCINFCLYRI